VAGPSGMNGSDIIDYGPNALLSYAGGVSYNPAFCTAIRVDAGEFTDIRVIENYHIKVTTSERLAANDYIDLIDQSLARTGPALVGDERGNRWNTETRMNVAGYYNPFAIDEWNYVYKDANDVSWCKFDRISLSDRTTQYAGGYQVNLNGFDLYLDKSTNGNGITSAGAIGANWNVTVRRFDRR
jgi:hypothetical protein